jgi:DNA primase
MNAARRAGEIALKLGFKIKMMTLLGAKDPDELISKDVEAWKLAVKNAKWFLDVYIDFGVENFEYGSLEQKHYVQKELVSLVMSISDKFDKEHYVQKIATTFSVSEKLLVGGKTETVPSLEEKKSVLKKEQNVIDDKRILLDKQILGGLFINKDFAKFLKENAELEDFTYEPVVDVMKIVLSGEEFLDLGDPLVKESVFMMEDVLRMHEGKQLAFQNSLESTFWGLRLLRVKELQEQVMSKLKQAEVRGEAEEALKLREEFAELMKRRMEVEGRR